MKMNTNCFIADIHPSFLSLPNTSPHLSQSPITPLTPLLATSPNLDPQPRPHPLTPHQFCPRSQLPIGRFPAPEPLLLLTLLLTAIRFPTPQTPSNPFQPPFSPPSHSPTPHSSPLQPPGLSTSRGGASNRINPPEALSLVAA